MFMKKYFNALRFRLWNWQYEALLVYGAALMTQRRAIQAGFARLHTLRPARNTAFLLGSGYSINSITPAEWRTMRAVGDMFSFNYFYYGDFVEIDYHIMREVAGFRSLFSSQTHRLIKEYTDSLLQHPRYTNTRFFLLFDRKSINTTLVSLRRLLPEDRVIFYSNLLDRRVCWPISEDGRKVPHCSATLFDAVNLAYLLGYKTIVLVGVDLYDRRYFWLKETESRNEDLKRGATFADVHQTAKPVLENMARWQKYLNDGGVSLQVYNPKSLLAGSLPVYYLP